MFETLKRWDREFFVFLNNLGVESYDIFWITVTNTIFWIPLFVLIAILIFRAYKKTEAILITVYFLLAVFVNIVLMLFVKIGIGRLRPTNLSEFEGLIRALQQPESFSFYSGHASSSFLIATLSVLLLRKQIKWVYVFFLFPLLFSWSRVYVGVHYPSDLIVGAIIGTLLAIVFYKRCVLILKR